jgi:hypothetical protein
MHSYCSFIACWNSNGFYKQGLVSMSDRTGSTDTLVLRESSKVVEFNLMGHMVYIGPDLLKYNNRMSSRHVLMCMMSVLLG